MPGTERDRQERQAERERRGPDHRAPTTRAVPGGATEAAGNVGGGVPRLPLVRAGGEETLKFRVGVVAAPRGEVRGLNSPELKRCRDALNEDGDENVALCRLVGLRLDPVGCDRAL